MTPMDPARVDRLQSLGVVPYRLRAPTTAVDQPWETLKAEVARCTRCALCESRTQTVFGTGALDAELVVVGEAPGAEEDRRGEPFVGRAGQLLDAMLQAAGWAREQVFIANVLKCRPPGNRDPSAEEIERCLPYLGRQLEALSPRAVLCVGRIAAQALLATDVPIGKLRGRMHAGPGGLPLVVTYHPAYLLRSPGEKAKSWADLKLLRATLGLRRGG